jgi:hypothetical protein
MNASLDGYYIMNPYHWGGGYSSFDPRMVQSAQLSHGVFSTRHGHTVFGLLDITSKKPSPVDTEFELGASTSAANFNLSLPFENKGGILIMGRVTYLAPVVLLTQQLGDFYQEIGLFTREQIEYINAVRTAPYIRSGTLTGNYRFTDKLELHATGFWGMDGVGFSYKDESKESAGGLSTSTNTELDWTNYQGFLTAALNWNPRNDMLVKFSLGTGYEDTRVDVESENIIRKKAFSNDFYEKYPEIKSFGLSPAPYDRDEFMRQNDLMFNVQARADYDWELGKGFLVAAGVQELFTSYNQKGDQQGFYSKRMNDNEKELFKMKYPVFALLSDDKFLNDLRIAYPSPPYSTNAENSLFTTSGYGLLEYVTPDKKFNAELGLRIDHYYLLGDGFSFQTKPALNPRLNADFNALKNKWIFESLDISAGTGLFSTLDDTVFMAEKEHNLSEIKPGRSWTSVLGAKITFPEGMSLNIEGYYKHIFDRMYIPVRINPEDITVHPQFDGEGRVWGIDIMLQKLQSRYWDGWLSYSYSWAKYRDPSGGNANMGISGGTRGNDWYFPGFHRFHNLNLVVNIKPAPQFNLYTRFGFASGTQLPRRLTDRPTTYPVLMYDDSDNSGEPKFIQRYDWPSVRDENNRVTPTLSMDIKFSIFEKNPTGKTRSEIYFAVENLLSLVYIEQGNVGFNTFTGEIGANSDSASYGLPIPIPSFGFKFSY